MVQAINDMEYYIDFNSQHCQQLNCSYLPITKHIMQKQSEPLLQTKPSPYITFHEQLAQLPASCYWLLQNIFSQMLDHQQKIQISKRQQHCAGGDRNIVYQNSSQSIADVLMAMCTWKKVKQIIITNCLRDQHVVALTYPKFEDLVELNLWNNNLCSIESLGKLNAPQLKILVLSNNRITQIKAIRRMLTPKLNSIYLMNTEVQDWEPISHLINVKYNKKFTHLSTHWMGELNRCHDLGFLFKMGGVTTLSNYSSNIIRWVGLDKQLSQCCQTINYDNQ